MVRAASSSTTSPLRTMTSPLRMLRDRVPTASAAAWRCASVSLELSVTLGVTLATTKLASSRRSLAPKPSQLRISCSTVSRTSSG